MAGGEQGGYADVEVHGDSGEAELRIEGSSTRGGGRWSRVCPGGGDDLIHAGHRGMAATAASLAREAWMAAMASPCFL